MPRMLIDVDQDLLREVEAEIALAEASPSAVVNAALRRAVETARERRRESFERLQRLFDEGAFDLAMLDELDR
jgi:Arc/MetJ family transcription regulator